LSEIDQLTYGSGGEHLASPLTRGAVGEHTDAPRKSALGIHHGVHGDVYIEPMFEDMEHDHYFNEHHPYDAHRRMPDVQTSVPYAVDYEGHVAVIDEHHVADHHVDEHLSRDEMHHYGPH